MNIKRVFEIECMALTKEEIEEEISEVKDSIFCLEKQLNDPENSNKKEKVLLNCVDWNKSNLEILERVQKGSVDYKKAVEDLTEGILEDAKFLNNTAVESITKHGNVFIEDSIVDIRHYTDLILKLAEKMQ